ncbi:hypothetical protein [Streptomyces sp. NPDC088358]|uniref:hypothetical protein n=1 Tax=Streptomyces sp. NPDC088358 TaxID=3365857 RepID=UPI003813E5B0
MTGPGAPAGDRRHRHLVLGVLGVLAAGAAGAAGVDQGHDDQRGDRRQADGEPDGSGVAVHRAPDMAGVNVVRMPSAAPPAYRV